MSPKLAAMTRLPKWYAPLCVGADIVTGVRPALTTVRVSASGSDAAGAT
jgi:hypothetical protein